jgi:hypothetical protein
LGLQESLAKEIAASARRENPSLSLTAMQVGVRILEILGGNVSPGTGYHERILPQLEAIPGPKFSLSEDETWVIDAASRKETQYLEKEFGIKFGESEDLPIVQAGLEEAAVDTMARALLARAGIGDG